MIDTEGDPHSVMIDAKFRVKPRRMRAAEHMVTPATMNGLLRPKRDFELSAMTPAQVINQLRQGESVIRADRLKAER